ncbi:MAG TPA: hypothetical protein VNA26_00685 [Chitinophagaceae bacterium]|nr:hypothetical protein [Chitinophagaceae bacterium]
MKLTATVLLLLFAYTGFAQTISMTGIGDIKIGMKRAELEKLTGTKVKLKNLAQKNGYRDTLNLTYKEIAYQVQIEKTYMEQDKYEITVAEVRTSNPGIKTKSGIGIGDDKIKIINTYPDYTIHIMPEYEDDAYTIKSKTKSIITIYSDETANMITFHLINNKVTAVSVSYSEGC